MLDCVLTADAASASPSEGASKENAYSLGFGSTFKVENSLATRVHILGPVTWERIYNHHD